MEMEHILIMGAHDFLLWVVVALFFGFTAGVVVAMLACHNREGNGATHSNGVS